MKTLNEIRHSFTHVVVADILDSTGQVTPVCLLPFYGEGKPRLAILDKARETVMEFSSKKITWSEADNCFIVQGAWPHITTGYK